MGRVAQPSRWPGISDQRRRADPLAGPHLVPGHDLVPDDAQDRPGDARRDMGGVPVRDELEDALVPGEGGAGPDNRGDADTACAEDCWRSRAGECLERVTAAGDECRMGSWTHSTV